MRTILMLASILCLTAISKAQLINESAIVGKWTVVKIIKHQPDTPEYKLFADMFKDAIFVFNKDYTFQLKSPNPNTLFAEVEEMTKDTRWKFDAKTNKIFIGNKKDNYSILHLKMKQNDNTTFIEMDEDEFYLLFEIKREI